MTAWFNAHKNGLRQIAERTVEKRGFGAVVGAELYQNVMDTDSPVCIINIKKIKNSKFAEIECIDEGHGFNDLSHAWTMFAPSEKKGDPTKAGRFNVGEKMVLSFCKWAEIKTTSGTVIFNEDGRKNYPRRKISKGTVFSAVIDCTQERFSQFVSYMTKIIVDSNRNLRLIVNDLEIEPREPIHTFECALPTEIGDNLRPSVRIAEVKIYEPLPNEIPSLYELGIPVVETGDKWHVNIMQKVPLNIDRDNVTPSFLKKVRVAVFNEMYKEISEDDTTETWVNEAADSKDCSGEAATTFLHKKYGEKSVALDPSDVEANNRATAAGYEVIAARGLTKGQRENLKEIGVLKSSSALFPTSKPYSDNPDAKQAEIVLPNKWSEGMKLVCQYTEEIGGLISDGHVSVLFVNTKNNFAACCGPHRELHYNIRRLGRKWFQDDDMDNLWFRVDKLMIHELAHIRVDNHLSDAFHDECCRLGAKLKQLGLKRPELFVKYN